MHPEALQAGHFEVLFRCLPGVDVLNMVKTERRVLRFAPHVLESRVRNLLRSLPRHDMAQIVGKQPRLLRLNEETLSEKARSISDTYPGYTILDWSQARVAQMLMIPLERLQRLHRVHPHVRKALNDKAVMRMRDHKFEEMEKRWRKRWRSRHRQLLAAQPRRNPLGDALTPRRGNVLQWARETKLRQQQQPTIGGRLLA